MGFTLPASRTVVAPSAGEDIAKMTKASPKNME
jgi:hypothetical protein